MFPYSFVSNDQRNLGCLYGTAEGTCPGDRHFGIDQSFESYPLNVAQNMFALEVIEKTEEYEKHTASLQVLFKCQVTYNFNNFAFV